MIKTLSTKARNQSPYPTCYIARTGIRKKEMEASSNSKVEANPDFLTPIMVFFRELFPSQIWRQKCLECKAGSRRFPISVPKQPISEPTAFSSGEMLNTGLCPELEDSVLLRTSGAFITPSQNL